MRDRGPTRIAWLCACLVLGLTASGWAQGRRAGTVISVQGTTQVERLASNRFEDAVRNMPLYPGDTLRTGSDGRAALLLVDDSDAKLDVNTTAQLLPPRGVPLFLRRGKYWGRPRHGMAPRTPVARILPRGTELNVEVAEDGTTTLTVVEGEAEFATDQGSVIVGERQQSIARPGAAPTTPVPAVNLPFILEWTNDVQPVALLLEMSFVSPAPGGLPAAEREAEELPPGPERLQRLGDVQHDRGRLPEALEAYEAARQALGPAAPVEARAKVEARIGQTLLELGKVPEAAAAFQSSLALNPALTPARAGLVLVLLSRRQIAAAIGEARTAVAQAADSPLAHTVLALAQIRAGDRVAARQELAQAMSLDASYAPAYAWQSFLQRADEQLEEAQVTARRAVELAPDSSLARQSLADALLALGQTAAARREAERAVALNPLSPGAHVSLGRVWVQEGELERALREANQAVALDPELDRARFFRGVVLAEQRRLAEAAKEIEVAVRQDAGYLEAQAFLARVYLEQGRRGDADRVVREAVARNPEFAPARAALGRVYWRAGRLREATEQYEAALRLSPESVLYPLELARVHLDGNRLPEALKQALAAVGKAPRSSEAHAILGLVYDRMSNPEQALRQYREAVALSPENALARFGIGLSLLSPNAGGALLEAVQAGVRDKLRDAPRDLQQAVLRDPSVATQFFKPGVTTEIDTAGGSEGRAALGLTHRDQYAQGKLFDLSFASHQTSDDYRSDRQERGSLVLVDVAAAPDYRTHLLGVYAYSGIKSAFPGPTFQPDADAEGYDLTNLRSLSARYQVDPATFVWLHLAQSVSHLGDENPTAVSDAALEASSAIRGTQLGAEGRVDRLWGDGHTTTYVFAAAREHVGGRQRRLDPLPSPFLDIEATRHHRLVGHTLQHDYRHGSRFSLLLGVTTIRFTEEIRLGRADGGPRALLTGAETGWFPFGVVSYGLTERDLVRALFYGRRPRGFISTLQPADVFLLGEAPLFPQGEARSLELGYEHRFSPRSFVKLFLFRTDVEDFDVAPSVRQTQEILGFVVPEVRTEGIGLHYERQLGRFLSGYLGYTTGEATDRTPGPTHGRQLPMNPRSQALFGLNYVDSAGTKLFAEATWQDHIYTDPFWSDSDGFDPRARRPRFSSRTLVNVRWAKERTVRHEWVFRINNLFDTDTLYWPGFPAPGRSYQLEYRYRF